VYQSADLGTTWSRFGEALPNAPVTDLQLIPGLNLLAAATYGRGVWEIQLGAVNRVWTGQGSTANWNDPNNWSGHVAPAAGDNLWFGSNAAQLTNTNNFAAGTTFGSIVFSSAGYSISGNSMVLRGYLDGSAATGNNTFNPGVTLGSAATVLTGGSGTDLTLGGAVALNGGLMLTVGGGFGRVDLTGVLSGNGLLTINDPGGTAALSGPADTYTGRTTAMAGTLLLGKSGTAVPGPLVIWGGTVQLTAANQTAATTAVVMVAGQFQLNNFSDTIASLNMTNGTVSTGTGTLTLAGNVTALGTSSISGNLALGTAARTFTVYPAATLNVSAVVSGGVGLTKAGSGNLVLTAANSYTGGTTVSAGTLTVGNNTALGTGPLTLVFAVVTANGSPVTLANPLTLAGNFSVAGTADLTFSGPATLTTTPTVTTTNTGLTTFAGNIGQSTSGLGLTKGGAGTLVLSGTNSFTGTTTINAGTLLVNGAQGGSPVSVHSGATLGGTGVVGTITALPGGKVTPGVSATQTGILSTAAATLSAASTFCVQVNGTSAGSGYSQLSASGTVTITGSTLSFVLGFTPAIGNAFTIINNTGAGAIVGTFQGLPSSGSTFTLSGMTFTINYAGGDGNDVVVTRTA
ncbi:MAG: autotransporter-associated beta strand repeat-containing protein, partial [Planctomycetes bacterium]|nr:autotransporter-associated beta strand repeat-containing protein [Planctomycetota bacterium]